MRQIITLIAVFSFGLIFGQACNGLTSITYNGYTYDLVEIGTQCWFKENLRTTMYRDSTPIDYLSTNNTAWQNNTTGAYAWYDNDSTSYASNYGALYNWYAVDNSSGLCPTGWHVPSDSAWVVLDSFLAHNGYNYDGSITGNKYAKAMADTVLWDGQFRPASSGSSITKSKAFSRPILLNAATGAVGNTDSPTYRNKSGFSGLPGGFRHSCPKNCPSSCCIGSKSPSTAHYQGLGNFGCWWSSKLSFNRDRRLPSSRFAWYRGLNYNYSSFNKSTHNRELGFSVRCMKE